MIQKNKWTIRSGLMLLAILPWSACSSRLPECSDRLGYVTFSPNEPIELGGGNTVPFLTPMGSESASHGYVGCFRTVL
ncbi:MAG: hypothetical protein J7545_13845 [Roseofilum sp. SBFL]|uniref:hypothetical protein n=1 Tax=unclassified Roseofilum TaxID=2620099 RepID=UPI001B2380A4|nr:MULTISPECIES: hypothetical protein [unclassified Roseofilum]MBP0014196.1 hypothetical protein [Roseofilum sp. SID3]MBP0025105.1 hypothetical protein [Roseofilum sp. SID2]MBP0034032.1 hypothetical protein [Roseofilum sp. Belize BBD 4]MBP0038018.1 hypothetical protein [Roseofilum sp. SID1]MBP0043033.1 hypothetical protein [Roseofilum sp. SBFL]